MKDLSGYVKADDVIGAEKFVKKTLKENENVPKLWLTLARIEMAYPIFDEFSALAYCKKAIFLSKDFLDAYVFMAAVQTQTMARLDPAVDKKLYSLSKTEEPFICLMETLK